MTQSPEFDTKQAHRHFSVNCFNQTWELIDKPQRTPDDEEQMILLSLASLWHWKEREDCTDSNLSIGYWLISRVYSIVGTADEARRYALLCLRVSPPDKPFFVAYAHEALARAERLAGNMELFEAYHREGMRRSAEVDDAEDRGQLIRDLEAL